MAIVIRLDERGYWGSFHSTLEASKILASLRTNPTLPDADTTSWPCISGAWTRDSKNIEVIRDFNNQAALFLVLRDGIWCVWVGDYFLNADFIR